MPVLKPNEGKKVDPAHPAIFPTGHKPRKLASYQKKVYDMIVRRFMAVFAEPALREQTRVVIDIKGEDFVAHGIRTLKANWMEFYKPYISIKEQLLPEINKGDPARNKKLDMPIAVVLCKSDYCPECFDDPRKFIQANLDRFWNLCESRLGNVEFFACSVVGSLAYAVAGDESSDYVRPIPLHTALQGILEPFEWIIDQV